VPPDSFEYPLRGGPGTQDPERIVYRNISLERLVMTAFNLQLPSQLSAPTWIEKEKYEISAKVPSGATKEQLSRMLQSLLEDRFLMKVHNETRALPIYELTVMKKGVIEKSTLDPPQRPLSLPPGPTHILLGRACARSTEPTYCGHARMFARQQSSTDIADMVREMMGHLTVDKTRLTGKYDFTLDFSPDSVTLPNIEPPGALPPVNGDSYPSFSVALQRQLGLKLDAKKGPVDVLVIDRIEKVPTGN
jgi:uncharacterized protein (TIGR03435 family)